VATCIEAVTHEIAVFGQKRRVASRSTAFRRLPLRAVKGGTLGGLGVAICIKKARRLVRQTGFRVELNDGSDGD
jgi:hypothetical protein